MDATRFLFRSAGDRMSPSQSVTDGSPATLCRLSRALTSPLGEHRSLRLELNVSFLLLADAEGIPESGVAGECADELRRELEPESLLRLAAAGLPPTTELGALKEAFCCFSHGFPAIKRANQLHPSWGLLGSRTTSLPLPLRLITGTVDLDEPRHCVKT